MINPLLSSQNPFVIAPPKLLKPSLCMVNPSTTINRKQRQNKNKNETHFVKAKVRTTLAGFSIVRRKTTGGSEEKMKFWQEGGEKMAVLCGFGYWVQGFRCFPWLALNFHMAHSLGFQPSTLQLLQNSGNLPMVAKPLYGVLSDVLYIGGGRRIPYISTGVLLQILGWGPLALIPTAREALPSLMACVLLSNLGASITEVAKDALVAEYGLKHRMNGLQSYAYMASAAGGILGNLLGGYCLLKTPPRIMFLVFAALLSLQLTVSASSREESLGLQRPTEQSPERSSVLGIIKKQFSNLKEAVQEDDISRPLIWIVASIAMVPLLSGSIFCYQTQALNLDPSIIGMSKVIGQLMLLSLTMLYDHYWKAVPMRQLIAVLQLAYAFSLLLDFILVKQINVRLGISNEAFVLCFSSLAETQAQFKLLPFSVLLANLCPQGCEGSLTSFLASTLCLSSIVSGFLGVGLASLIGITSGNYSNLPLGTLMQCLAALVPLGFIHYVPMSQPAAEKERKRGMSKRSRKNRRVGRVSHQTAYAYRRERESEAQMK